MERQTSSGELRRLILVAAVPNDPQALGLVKELRATGLNVMLAETVGLASMASEMAVCIVVLHPETWRTTPSITTVIRANPPQLIPVLAEPMALPNGRWTGEAVQIGDTLPEAASELARRIADYMQTLPEAVSPNSYLPRDLLKSVPLHKEKSFSRPRPRMPWNYLLLVAILLIASGIFWNVSRHPAHPYPQSLQTAPTRMPTPQSYTAIVPGSCDIKGSNYWSVGDHYKDIVTPTGSSGSPSPVATVTGTPTIQVIQDPYTVTSCQQDGLLVKHMQHYDSYATIIFENGLALPHHFSVEITAALISGSNSAMFGLDPRRQDGANSNSENGYGNNTFDVGVDGGWETDRLNDKTDQVDAILSRGFVSPAKTFTLAAVVDGPVMKFLVNGKIVTTITDTTFPESYGIDFGISDPDAKNPPTALFSHFRYTVLSATQLKPDQAVVTATAQAAKDIQAPYTASIPGFGCDKGDGQWQPVSTANENVTARCLSNGLAMMQSESAQYIGNVPFYGLNGHLPVNYVVKANVSITGGCAGFTTRDDGNGANYAFFICSDGFWQIKRYDDNGGDGYQLAQGSVAPRQTYLVEARSQGFTQSLTLDGVCVSSVTDKTLSQTDHITLSMSTNQGSAATAMFSNFVLTPLP